MSNSVIEIFYDKLRNFHYFFSFRNFSISIIYTTLSRFVEFYNFHKLSTFHEPPLTESVSIYKYNYNYKHVNVEIFALRNNWILQEIQMLNL